MCDSGGGSEDRDGGREDCAHEASKGNRASVWSGQVPLGLHSGRGLAYILPRSEPQYGADFKGDD